MACGCKQPKGLGKGHPCFSPQGHGNTGRIHLPVAPKCNISCGYCVRKFDCANESRPGVTSKITSPLEAMERVRQALDTPIGPQLKVIGIAGPGDPLANEETFQTLELIKELWVDRYRCISTNGLNLPDNVGRLRDLGVSHITVTMNTLEPETGAKIYRSVRPGGRHLTGVEGASLLLERQLAGIEEAVDAGMTVKINTVVIPGINDHQLVDIAEKVSGMGASIMNLIPLISQGALAFIQSPTSVDMAVHRLAVGSIMPQMSHCSQCRADAIGLLGGGEQYAL